MKTPWERQRFIRYVNQYFGLGMKADAGDPEADREYRKLDDPSHAYLPLFSRQFLGPWMDDGPYESLLRSSELALALLLYRSRHQNHVAKSLNDLVPAEMAAVRTVRVGPFENDPFVYHVSHAGEQVDQIRQVWKDYDLEEQLIKVRLPAGVGVLEWKDRHGYHTYLVPAIDEKKP